jgi:hypothetical protein
VGRIELLLLWPGADDYVAPGEVAMTDEGTTPDRRPNLLEDDTNDRHTSREAWEQLPPDPDAESHLGYDLAEWEEVETTDGSDKRILLPADSEMVRDDAFIVADRDALVDLPGKC